jgi:multidrug resistance protein MdtO
MGAAAQLAPQWPQPLTWLREFLREELAPYPGRGALVARMMIAASIVTIINMTFRIPFGAFGVVYALTISRENPEATLKSARDLIVWFCIGVAGVLIGALCFSGDPILRLVWVFAVLFITFFLLSALSDYTAAARLGYLVVITIPVWDQHISENLKVENTLWAVAAVAIGSVVTALVEVTAARLRPVEELAESLGLRLHCVIELLRSLIDSASDSYTEQQVIRFSLLGTSRMRRYLQRSGYAPDYAEKMGAVVAYVGRLVDVAANLPHFPPQSISPANRARLVQIVENLAGMRADILEGRMPTLVHPPPSTDPFESFPLLRELERTVSMIAEAFTGSSNLVPFAAPADAPDGPSRRLFVPDAFTNADHIRFGIKGALAASACYLIYNLADWPEVSTSVTTCVLTALTTVGASRQKQVLRFAGALVGGAIGIGSQVFILPGLDSITGFMLLFLAVSIPSAWFATSGPRLSYFGIQVATAFYLINLLEFKFQTSLSVGWDRVAGVLLGLFAMWLIFDQLWSTSAITAMRQTFISSLRQFAQLFRGPYPEDRSAAVERTYALRGSINSSFEKLREHGDGVMLEFGRTRDHDLMLRQQIIDWQIRLRTVFVVTATLLKYRLNLPGFELPEPVRAAQKAYAGEVANRIDAMADRLEGRPQAPGGEDREVQSGRSNAGVSSVSGVVEGDAASAKDGRPAEAGESAFERLKRRVQEYETSGTPVLAANLRTYFPLCERVEALTRNLADEIR